MPLAVKASADVDGDTLLPLLGFVGHTRAVDPEFQISSRGKPLTLPEDPQNNGAIATEAVEVPTAVTCSIRSGPPGRSGSSPCE